MHLSDIAYNRLINQQIAHPTFRTAPALVHWMGAIQAQDYNMAKWAIGVRLPESTDKQISDALDRGELIRTHLLRPTWHIVAAEDIYWMLALSAPQIKPLMKSRDKVLEITENLYASSNALIEKALAGGKQLTRQELMDELEKAKIATDNNRAAHFMIRAELDGIVANGICRGKKQTYALLEERVPKTKPLHREEALAKLARTYFVSHGPATLADFVWWSGLSITEARHALEMVKATLVSDQIDSQTYWFSDSLIMLKDDNESVYLLPAFDEYTISYKDRSAALTVENHKQAISENGIFNPVVVVNGNVVGTWKRTLKKDKLRIEPCFFQSPNSSTLRLLEKACVPLGHFLGQEIQIAHQL